MVLFKHWYEAQAILFYLFAVLIIFLFKFQNVYVLPWTESEEYGDFLKRLEDPLVWNGSDKGGDDVGAALGPLSPRHLVSEGNISASSQIHTLKESKFQFTTLSLQFTGIIVIYMGSSLNPCALTVVTIHFI